MAATIYLYDSIGWSGISSRDFANTLSQLEAAGETEFVLRINSPGGSVFDGYAIYNLLKSRNVVVVIDGIAASIASVIALAGKKVVMNSLSMLMIHNPWIMAAGDVNEFAKVGLTLDAIGKQIAGIYQAKTGKDFETVKAWMDAEKYMTHVEAKELGFVDEIENGIADKKFVAMYVTSGTQSDRNGFGIQAGDNFSTTKIGDEAVNEKLLALLGLPKDATEAQVLAKLAEVRNGLGIGENESLDVFFNSQASELVKDVTKLKAAFEALTAANAANAAAQVEAQAVSLVDGAVTAGKILPVVKDVFVVAAKADYAGTKAKLDAMPAGASLPGKIEVDKSDKPENLITAAAEYTKALRGAK